VVNFTPWPLYTPERGWTGVLANDNYLVSTGIRIPTCPSRNLVAIPITPLWLTRNSERISKNLR